MPELYLFSGLISFTLAANGNFILKVSCISLLVFAIVNIVPYCAIFYLICKCMVLTSRADEREGNVTGGGFPLSLKASNKVERSVLLNDRIMAISFNICTYPFVLEISISHSLDRMPYISKAVMIFYSKLNPFIYFFKSFGGSRILFIQSVISRSFTCCH